MFVYSASGSVIVSGYLCLSTVPVVLLVYLVTCTVSVYSGSVDVSGYLYCVCLQW